MDRRNNPESQNSHSYEQFQKAYEVISLSYKGVEPERLYSEALTCFDSLIELSIGNETIRDFAHLRGIDMKYLVDGANFVISKMHFNPENNYYLTLGLPQNAAPEEVNRRWKKLMLLYHPDKQGINKEWVSERAKKVNEAYTALKDETKRAEYDYRLSAQKLSRKFQSASSPGTSRHHRPAGAFSRQGSHKSAPGWNSIRAYLPKILISVYVLIALIVLGFIYIENRSSHLEAELVSQSSNQDRDRKETAATIAQNPVAVEQTTSNILPAVTAEPIQGPARAPREAKETTREITPLPAIQSWIQPRKMKKTHENAKPVVGYASHSRDEDRENRIQENAGLQSAPSKPIPADQAHREEAPKQYAGSQRVVAEEQRMPVEPLQQKKQPEPEPSMTEQITKEEVGEFMQRYVSAYSSNDLNTFLSLFSRSAVENNTLTYNEIRSAYKETFSEKINHYKISNMVISIDGQTATVSGTYAVNRYFSHEDRWIRYTGKIVWKIIRENTQLRIIKTNYDK